MSNSKPMQSIEAGWQQDAGLSKMIAEKFQPKGQVMVPGNPQATFSFMPRPAESMGYPGYDQIGQQGLTKNANPYGDAVSYQAQQTPVIVPVTPAVERIMAAPPTKDAADQPRTPGYGFSPKRSPLARIDAAQSFAPPKPLGEQTQQSVPLGMTTSLDARPFGRTPKRRMA